MTLRDDEKFVADCLKLHFGAGTDYREGEDPPDIYLKMNGETIAVEVTRVTPVSFNEDGYPENRTTQDMFGINLCDEMNNELGHTVSKDIDIILILIMPLKKPSLFRKELFLLLKKMISNGLVIGEKHKTVVTGEEVRIVVIPNREHSPKKIIGIISNKNARPELSVNAEIMLYNRIKTKDEICRKSVDNSYPKWLALFNNYYIIDGDEYKEALNNISIDHCFDRILLIEDNETVHELYRKES